MNNRIKMSPDEVIEIAKVYNVAASDIEAILGKLAQTQAILSTQWEGMAFRAFEDQYHQIVPVVKDFANLMSDIYKQLNMIAQTLKDTDLQISSSLKSALIK